MSQVVKRASRRFQEIRANWAQHIAACAASGLTQAAYCREHQLNARYLSLWKRKLRRATEMSAANAAPALIPVVIKPAHSVRSNGHSSSSPCDPLVVKATLRNGVAIEVQVSNTQALTPVLSQLAQLAC